MPSAGNFKIDVWKGGYPVCIVVHRHNEQIAKFDHTEICDLIYALERAKKEAINELPENYRAEV